MPLYRVIRSSRGSALPSSSWMCKPTDEAAIAAARELLKRGDYAEVWGEHALIACLEPGARSAAVAAPTRSVARMPTMRYVAAGFATTAGIALVFAALQGRGVSAEGRDVPPATVWAMLDPATAGAAQPNADPVDGPSAPTGAAISGSTLSGAPDPATGDAAGAPTAVGALSPPPGTDPDSVAAGETDPAEVQATLAALTPEPAEAPAAEAPAAPSRAVRHVRHRPAPAHWRAAQGQVFASGERSTVDVYGMFARGYVQGGN